MGTIATSKSLLPAAVMCLSAMLVSPQARGYTAGPAPETAHTLPQHLEHDVPDSAGDEEVPIAWTIKDSRLRRRPQMLTTDLGVWPDTLSLGIFWASPVLPRGFIRHVNDSFDLEFGVLLGAFRADWMWESAATSWQLWPAFGARWNFFLTRNWSTFATFKLAGRINLSGPDTGWFSVIGGLGANYRIKDRVHLRLELNFPQGAVVGLSFPLGGL